MQFNETTIEHGVWIGRLSAEVGAAPDLHVTLDGLPLEGALEILPTDDPTEWEVRVDIPKETIDLGAKAYLICEAHSDTVIGSFTLIAGEPLAHEFVAEMELLRAELDMLKRAFRRHCLETAG